jgi:hypothetical protein
MNIFCVEYGNRKFIRNIDTIYQTTRRYVLEDRNLAAFIIIIIIIIITAFPATIAVASRVLSSALVYPSRLHHWMLYFELYQGLQNIPLTARQSKCWYCFITFGLVASGGVSREAETNPDTSMDVAPTPLMCTVCYFQLKFDIR